MSPSFLYSEESLRMDHVHMKSRSSSKSNPTKMACEKATRRLRTILVKASRPRRLDDGRRQVAQRQEAHPAEGSRMEVGGVPFADVRRGHDRRAGLHREERLLEAGGDRK